MRYDVALAAAEMDAQMYAVGTVVEIAQDAESREIVLRVAGETVATYSYRD